MGGHELTMKQAQTTPLTATTPQDNKIYETQHTREPKTKKQQVRRINKTRAKQYSTF
jgi:hypothetical protein